MKKHPGISIKDTSVCTLSGTIGSTDHECTDYSKVWIADYKRKKAEAGKTR